MIFFNIEQLISFFVRELLEPFALVLLGGVFVLAEISLSLIKGDLPTNSSLRRPRPALRMMAVFCFVIAVVVAAENLNDNLFSVTLLKHRLLLGGLTLLLTIMILFFGVLLPRAIAETRSSFWLTQSLGRLACTITRFIDPFAIMIESIAIQFLKLFGLHLYENVPASDEEIINMMDEGLSSGVFKASEREMVQGVLDLDQQITASLMTPRSSFVWLNLDDEDEKNWYRIAQSGHSEFPVFQGTHDRVIGIVSVKALWVNLALTGSVRLADVTMTPVYVSCTMTASKLLEEFRSKKRHTALVIDEFDVVEGIVTLKDVMESIMGMLPERGVKHYYPEIIHQDDDSWLVDALIPIDEAIDVLGLPLEKNNQEENRCQTLGGFFLGELGHIPHAGEFIIWENFRFEVVSMKQHRIEKLVVRKNEQG